MLLINCWNANKISWVKHKPLMKTDKKKYIFEYQAGMLSNFHSKLR